MSKASDVEDAKQASILADKPFAWFPFRDVGKPFEWFPFRDVGLYLKWGDETVGLIRYDRDVNQDDDDPVCWFYWLPPLTNEDYDWNRSSKRGKPDGKAMLRAAMAACEQAALNLNR